MIEHGEIPLTAGWVASAVGGALVAGDPGREFAGVSIDSRTLAAGELYVAIKGERFDGADFIDAAVKAGAAGAVVPIGRGRGAAGSIAIEVHDTTAALQALARAIRRASDSVVVAITGSTGKTTTKEMTAELLAVRYRVFRNRGNLNNHIGLPLSLVELRHRPDVAVVELGMNHTGEIRTLVAVAEPDIRLWTNVGDAHIGFFGSMDAIAEAKAEILEGATLGTRLVANADDPRVMAHAARFPGRLITFGTDRPADVRATGIEDLGMDGTRAQVTAPGGSIAMTVPLPGRGNLANVLAATAVAVELGIPLDEIAPRVATLAPAAHRGEIVRLGRGITVVDDSYNASPAATRRALDTIRATHGVTRRIAVLGEMLELGAQAEAFHREVGAAAATSVDVLVTVGGAPALAAAESAVAAGLRATSVRHVATSDLAADVVSGLVVPGDLVLVKGSRGIRTERVVERLKQDFA